MARGRSRTHHRCAGHPHRRMGDRSAYDTAGDRPRHPDKSICVVCRSRTGTHSRSRDDCDLPDEGKVATTATTSRSSAGFRPHRREFRMPPSPRTQGSAETRINARQKACPVRRLARLLPDRVIPHRAASRRRSSSPIDLPLGHGSR